MDTNEHATTPSAPAPADATRARRAALRGRGAAVLLVGLLLAAALLLAMVFWLMRSESGTRWLLSQTPGLEVARTQGALLGERFSAEGVRWRGLAGGASLEWDRLSWQGARWQLGPGQEPWLSLHIDELHIGKLKCLTGPSSPERLRPPGSLRLPFALEVQSLRIASLQIDAHEPARDIAARLALGAHAGQQHRLEQVQLHWQNMDLKGHAAIKADAPHLLELDLQAQAREGTPWAAQASVHGPLSSLALKLKLSGKATDRGPDPSLDAQAQIRPFETWALGDVDLSTRGLDLAALVPGAPRTQLSGHALIRSQGLREPVHAEFQIDNAAPARFSDGGLPVLALRATVKGVKGKPSEPDRLEIGPFVLDAADTRGAAGRWAGSGTWAGHQLQLQTRLTDLQPARLDQRLPAMQVGGPLQLILSGLPQPNPSSPSAQAWAGWAGVSAQAEAQFEGRISEAPQEVHLAFKGQADRHGLHLQQVLARSGAAQAQLSAHITRSTPQRWQVRSEGQLQSFDPRLWFPGSPATWGTGQHLFNGRWALDVSAPAQGRPAPQALAQWLPLLLGHADLKLLNSRLAGLPLNAEMELRQDSRSPRSEAPSRARVDLRLASAQLQLTGAGDASEAGVNDRTQIKLTVPALAELAPLASLWPAAAAWAPRRGELQVQADLTGRWPALNGQIQARAAQVQSGAAGAAHVLLEGQIERMRTQALNLRIEADDVSWQGTRLGALRGQVQGTVAKHRLELDVQAPLQPPPALAQALEWKPSGQTRAVLVGSGSWSSTPTDPGMAGRWAGLLEHLRIGNGKLGEPGKADASWLELLNVQADVQMNSDGAVRTVELLPGQARSGPLSLRWTEAQWQQVPGEPASWRLLGDLEPFALAPVLQRATGSSSEKTVWGGDLRVGARLDLRADSRFAADVLLRREAGDLVSNDAGTTATLGLEQAELRWQVKDGLWRFQPQISGRNFGNIGGELLARAQPTERWPRPATPIEGALDARVASLASWAPWLPAGWAVQGELAAMARLSGRWGAPEYTGMLSGDNVSVRNLLQGVDLKDGRLRVRLDGETARIESLSIRGGEGLLSAQGQARFGGKPELQLDAKADKLRVLGRVDRQLVLSGQAQLKLAADRLGLEGRITADSGLFDLSSRDAPSLDEDVTVHRQTEPAAAAPARAEASPWAKRAQVALDLDLGKQLHLRGRGLNTDLSGKLRLTTSNGRLLYQGAVQADGGTYAAYGQKLEIERGEVSFNGPLDRARLDILALRPNLDTRVGVVITGNTLEPRVRLYSEPEMSESEKLSWLVLGRGPEGLGSTDTALLQRAAMALLAGEGESPSDAALRRIGLDDFSIRQSDGEVRETVVSVGKQLGRRWYVGYERGVNATAGTWQLVYRIAQKFTLRAQSGSDNSLDMIWSWRFGQP